ncbi:Putative amidase domain-containing protein [Hathewaya proteolytica DSM 3090]|uniref:Putative amidase domain-containing protein n=1 Tax=Hathewaya proteolytica DSM 3090 TaxID=1121331 RepID=A0A1M6R986_9CLOT|nr:amidase domain-containing protein [Hathewaya proteolytica]SHK29049.1 Putative amidase domain-containing protein [Hathewaya proteolytica DSM 3090]
MKKKLNCLLSILCFFTFMFSQSICVLAETSSIETIENTKEMVKEFFTNVYNTRNNIIFTGDIKELKNYFNMNSVAGKGCIENEVCRMMYLRDWSSERGIKFTSVQSFPHINSIKDMGSFYKIQLDEDYKFKYIYDGENETENLFGISLVHYIKLQKSNDSYKILTDYYLDCFSDALKNYYHNLKKDTLPDASPLKYNISQLSPIDRELTIPDKPWKYNRLKAVEYARRYCGVRWVTDNATPRFNPKYTNYTGIGGNCTNYVSQCLGDKEGANMPQNGGWYTQKRLNNTYECSTPWVNADAFRNYIIYSGKGYLVKRGSFKTLCSSSASLPGAYFSKLNYGDIVSYEKKNDIDHNAIVCGFDSHGYPLINSHTVERYNVPFDLGWGDKNIFFHFVHIN